METLMDKTNWSRRMSAIGFLLTFVAWATTAAAQGVTTGTMTGLVKDAQGAVIPGATVTAVHQPSGTQYSAVTQEDGRFFIPAMRVGGPYKVSIELQGFRPEVMENVTVSLGTSSDLPFTLQVATVAEAVTVTGT